MILLIVDDQTTVLRGITNNVPFQSLDIDSVFTACSTAEAKKIMLETPIDILMTDIEMPGENGIQLLKWTAEHYPDIVSILLTSHADFSYAQEGIKLGCFDYVIQPAPYQEIEAALSRAVKKIISEQQKKHYYENGRLYISHKHELNDRTVLNLFSRNPSDLQQAKELLNQLGYPLSEQSSILLMVLDFYPLADSALAEPDLRRQITDALHSCNFDSPVYPLLTLNRFRQFVLVLFCNGTSLINTEANLWRQLYQSYASICSDLSVYIGRPITLSQLRLEIHRIDDFIKNNVNKKAGLYFTEEEKHSDNSPNISDNLAHWNTLLSSRQFDLLSERILSYIDFISSINVTNLKTLCDLHQQLTQLFFIYSYEHSIDVTSLFTEEYTYNEYMNAFTDTKALREATAFIIQAIAMHSDTEEQTDVIQLAKNYIRDNLSSNLSVKDVSDHVHLSPEYFTKIFKKEVGQNIKNYILQVKVDTAKDLLRNPNIPICMIALDLGYSNFSHFTQMFRKIEGLTPSEYRKKHTGVSS